MVQDAKRFEQLLEANIKSVMKVYVLPQTWCHHTLEPYSVLQMGETYAKQNKPAQKPKHQNFTYLKYLEPGMGGS